MRFNYDLTQAEPIIRDLPVCASADILEGAVVGRDGAISTELLNFGVTNVAAAVIDDVIGVAQEFYDFSEHINNIGTAATTAAGTGVTNYMKVCINPLAVWLAEWSQHADNDVVNTAAQVAGVGSVTGTFTSPGDDVEGDWVYISNKGSTTGGAGNLYQIGSASTTVWTPCSTWVSGLKAITTSDTYIKLVRPYGASVAGGSINLAANTAELGTALLGNDIVGDDTGAIMILQNYVKDKATPMEPLRVERHSGRNFDAATCKLYGDAFLLDHLCLGGGIATAPQIT